MVSKRLEKVNQVELAKVIAISSSEDLETTASVAWSLEEFFGSSDFHDKLRINVLLTQLVSQLVAVVRIGHVPLLSDVKHVLDMLSLFLLLFASSHLGHKGVEQVHGVLVGSLLFR